MKVSESYSRMLLLLLVEGHVLERIRVAMAWLDLWTFVLIDSTIEAVVVLDIWQ